MTSPPLAASVAPVSSPRVPPWLPWAAGVVLAVLLAGRLWWLPAHASLNINEGWNAGHALHAMGAGPLYPAPDGLTANNYPPLSFYIVGLAGRATGDLVVAGRLAALLSTAAVAVVVAALVRRLTGATGWAAAAALVFGAFDVTLLRNYLAMDDPQWLATALMGAGLLLVVPRRVGERPGAGALVAAAALMVCGGLAKHNLVAVPAATAVWLAASDRRAFAVWAGAGLAFAAAAVAGLYAVWGSTVFTDVVGAARSYSLARMAAKGGPLLPAVAPAALLCPPLWRAGREDARLRLPVWLLAVAAPFGVLQRSGDGVDVNACVEAVIAVSLVVPTALALRPARAGRWLALAVSPALVLVPTAAAADLKELRGRDAAVARAAPLVAELARATGPVACDDQALCYWAGRPSALDFFAWKQRLLKEDGAPLREAVARRRFALVEMRAENPGWHADRLRPLIREGYAVRGRADGVELLAPRP